MLLKLASMFLTNIFYYPKVIFKIKKRDTRLLHFWVIFYKLYKLYLKVDSSLVIPNSVTALTNLLLPLNF